MVSMFPQNLDAVALGCVGRIIETVSLIQLQWIQMTEHVLSKRWLALIGSRFLL